MNRTIKKTAITAAVLAVALSVCAVSAMAAGDETAASASCGYLNGQKRCQERHTQFEQVSGIAGDEEREEAFRAAGIGRGGAYEEAPHLNCEALAEAGVIDQDTAGRIADYAAGKHTGLHDWYAAKSDSLSPQERRAYFANRPADVSGGDSVEELLEAGVITQDQADAISGASAD